MHKAKQYLKFAEECEALAKQAKTERHRNILVEMARTWRRLADESETGGGGSSAWCDGEFHP
jgi:hypothetical protein